MMPQSARILTTACSKPAVPLKTVKESMAEPLAPSLHKAPGIQGRHRSHPPVLCRDLGSLSEADQTTGAVSPTLLALHPWHQMAKSCVERRSPQETHLPSIGSILLQVQQLWAGHVTRMEDVRMPRAVFFSELQEGKCDLGAQRSAKETACIGANQPSNMAAGSLGPRQLALISEKSQL